MALFIFTHKHGKMRKWYFDVFFLKIQFTRLISVNIYLFYSQDHMILRKISIRQDHPD